MKKEVRTARKSSEEIVQIIPEKENTKTPFIYILKKIFNTEDNAEDFHLVCDESFEDFKDMSANDVCQIVKDIGIRRFLTRKKLIGFYYFCHVKPLKSNQIEKYKYSKEGLIIIT